MFDSAPRSSLRSIGRRSARGVSVLAIVAFACGLLGAHAWFLDLFAHFRVQYGYALLACAALLSAVRDVKWASAVWIAAAWVTWPFISSELASDAAASAEMHAQPTFKVLTLNAWYRNPDTARVARYLSHSDADVILVQEFDARRMHELVAALPMYPHTAVAAAEDRHGAAILSRWPIEASRPMPLAGAQRHAQWAAVRWHSRLVQVVAVHLPWPLGPRIARERDEQLQALSQWMGQQPGEVIVGGDFNLSPWSAHFDAALELARAQDAIANRPALSTWPTQFPPLGIQIDHCLLSRDWQVVQTTRGPRVGSDHYPMLVEMRLKTREVIPHAPSAG